MLFVPSTETMLINSAIGKLNKIIIVHLKNLHVMCFKKTFFVFFRN